MRATLSQDRELIEAAGAEDLHLDRISVDAALRQRLAWKLELLEIAADHCEARARVFAEGLAPLAARNLFRGLDRERRARVERWYGSTVNLLCGAVEEASGPDPLRRHAATLRADAASALKASGYAASYLPQADEHADAADDLARARRQLFDRAYQARVDLTSAEVALARSMASRMAVQNPGLRLAGEGDITAARARLDALETLSRHLSGLGGPS